MRSRLAARRRGLQQPTLSSWTCFRAPPKSSRWIGPMSPVGRSMAASVAAECHLWLNLTEIREKEKVFLMDAPISQSGLFGEAVSAVVDKFRSAKTQSASLRQFMPKRARDYSTPSSSVSRVRKEPPSGGAQATRPSPTTVWGARGRSSSSPTTTQAG